MRLFVKLLLGLVVVLGLLIALNFSKIQRLQTVNTLFDADKIVHNFSNMKEAFLYQQLDGSAVPQPWESNPTPLPETVTIAGNERNLADLLEMLDTTAFIVIQDGKILNENYYKGTAATDHRISWSMAKSFMSGLYGAALESGQIKSLDDTVETYAPSLKGSAYEGATIRNVLNMASGITFDENYIDPKSDINDMGRVLGLGGSMDEYTAELTARDAPAGERWKYVSIDTHVAAMVLRGATGKTLHQMFNETYSANLGFEGNPYYMTDGKNVAFALGGLNLTTRDYAKFGQLFLQGGEWNGKQVIPAMWAAESTVHSAPNINGRGTGYGYQWWVPMPQEGANEGDFYAVGIYGQYIYINPAKNLVIAKNAADREFTEHMEGYGHSMGVNVDLFRSLADYYGISNNFETVMSKPFSVSGMQPLEFSIIEKDNTLFGCGCSFVKDGDWLYSSVHHEIGYFQSNNKITKLPSIKSSGEFWYGTKAYGNDEMTITYDIDESTAKKTGQETSEFDGAIIVTANGNTEIVNGKVSCGC